MMNASGHAWKLGNDSKQEESMEDDKRCGTNSDYKINVDISDFYGGIHVKEFLDWILMMGNCFLVYGNSLKETSLSLCV